MKQWGGRGGPVPPTRTGVSHLNRFLSQLCKKLDSCSFLTSVNEYFPFRKCNYPQSSEKLIHAILIVVRALVPTKNLVGFY